MLAACASQKPILGGGNLIDDVRLEGVRHFSKGEFLGFLFSGETRWIPFSPDYPFDEALVGVDEKRIEALYRSHGYLQARVLGIESRLNAKKGEADLVIRVEEGEQARVRTIRFEWPTECDVTPEVRAKVEAESTLAADGPFETRRVNETTGNLRQALLQRGYPLARVTGTADVREAAGVADATFVIEPGPFAKIGAIDFAGLVDVPRYMIDREVRFARNEPYSPERVRQIEQAVRGMRVFEWVNVRPPEKVEGGVLDLIVDVAESDPHRVKIGVQLMIENSRWQEQATFRYTYTNLFGNLTELGIKGVAGWAELPNPWAFFRHGPVLNVTPFLKKKGFLEDYLMWELAPAFDMNIEEGYQYWSTGGRAGVGRWFAGMWHVALNYNARYVDFFNTSASLDPKKTQLGRDFKDPFLLSYLELKSELYLTNAIVNPTDGAIFDVVYQVAGFFLGSGFDYQKVSAGVRGYWKPLRWFQFASRLQAGLILPFGRNPGAPLTEKFYLGGSSTVRGWGSRRLSPRMEECKTPDDCSSIPIGGYTLVEGNVELRFTVFGPLELVGFVDFGDVQAGKYTFVPAEWNFAAGPGIRVRTPLGQIRLDAGFHLNDPGVYDEPFWGIHFGFGEAF